MTAGRRFAKKALEIDPTLAEAYTDLGIISFWYDHDWPAAEAAFKRAIGSKEDFAPAHQHYAWFLAFRGFTQDGIAQGKRSVDLEPLSSEINTFFGITYFYSQKYDEAITQLTKTIEFEDNYWYPHLFLGRSYEQKGNLTEALKEFQKARQLEPEAAEIVSAEGYAYGSSGNRAEAEKIIEELKERPERSNVPSYNIAVIYASFGDKDHAFEWLEKALQEGSFFITLLKVDPELVNLHSDSRFTSLLYRLKLDS